jgi:hypothetical protein
MTAELSPEDELRLNVLLAAEVHAVRVDEGQQTLYALTDRGEAKVVLHRNCRADLYVQRVRELLGGHAMGSPGGYPVHLMRWNSMGQSSARSLAALLKLGEPEAVRAVAQAPGITDELARCAWWALPTMEVARYLLAHPVVCSGSMGPVLAEFLIEHLPFEEDPIQAMNAIRAVVGAGLMSQDHVAALWLKSKHRPHYFLGFLEHQPDNLPPETARSLDEDLAAMLVRGAARDDLWATSLARCHTANGQSYLRAIALALEKPPAPEAVFLALDLLGRYFAVLRDLSAPTDWPAPLQREVLAMVVLCQASQQLAVPILCKTTAVGPLMRRHLEPVLAPLLAQIQVLRGKA